MHIRIVFRDPVFSGQAGIEGFILYIDGHFLSTADGTIDAVVVDFRKIAPAVNVDIPAAALEERNGGVLQTSFGDAQLQFILHFDKPPSDQTWACL